MKQLSCITALALASASGLALTTAAQAQQRTNWTGFYVGMNAGYAWGRSDAVTSFPCPAPAPGFGLNLCFNAAIPPTIASAGTGSLAGDGFTGGVQLGYNWQSNQLVLGVEADFGAFALDLSRQVRANYPAFVLFATAADSYTLRSSLDTDWLLTVRGRVGMAFSDVMVYATGGLAVTNLKASHSFIDTDVFGPSAGTWSGSSTRLGLALGGGFEWALGRNWSVKAEYLHLNFGSVTASGVITHPGFGGGSYAEAISTKVDLTAHIARAGVNFRF
jgi:outer membrane immunogenic protein